MTTYGMYRAARIALAFGGDIAPGQTRKRVLMRSQTIGGTRYKAGTIVNSRLIRERFKDRENWQDRRLEQAIEQLDLQLIEAGLEP